MKAGASVVLGIVLSLAAARVLAGLFAERAFRSATAFSLVALLAAAALALGACRCRPFGALSPRSLRAAHVPQIAPSAALPLQRCTGRGARWAARAWASAPWCAWRRARRCWPR